MDEQIHLVVPWLSYSLALSPLHTHTHPRFMSHYMLANAEAWECRLASLYLPYKHTYPAQIELVASGELGGGGGVW